MLKQSVTTEMLSQVSDHTPKMHTNTGLSLGEFTGAPSPTAATPSAGNNSKAGGPQQHEGGRGEGRGRGRNARGRGRGAGEGRGRGNAPAENSKGPEN